MAKTMKTSSKIEDKECTNGLTMCICWIQIQASFSFQSKYFKELPTDTQLTLRHVFNMKCNIKECVCVCVDVVTAMFISLA